MKYDNLTLEANLIDGPDRSLPAIHYTLKVNGIGFYPKHSLCLFSLVSSCQSSGELYIITCGCGIPECAGIYQGIEVHHTDKAITWKCPVPLSSGDKTDSELESAQTSYEHFCFEPEKYLEAIDTGIKHIKSLVVTAPRTIEFPVHGVEIENVLALETRPFSSRFMNSNRQIVAVEVVVDGSLGFARVDGVGYRIEDLHLNDALMQEYFAWYSTWTHPSTKDEIPAYLAYLQRGRLFCRQLREYIGHETTVIFKYHPPSIFNQDAWQILEMIR